ncbi:hypothetical protein [Accumulibacter sp.]|uniref:hypothetical protein n=1 Tax=Accumulibacter sp. TaxID=2053492 RepID=UPI0028C40C74|nr:hypothetical protein [Accumulibacter sp.]
MTVTLPDRGVLQHTLTWLQLALFALTSALWAGPSAAAILEILLDHYVVSVTKAHTNYFNGKLLTEDDLSGDQSYQRSGERYLDPQPNGRPLEDLLQVEGYADIMLLLDERLVLPDYRAPVNPDNYHADDFIVLDPERGTWRGRLFIGETGGIESGVYDELSGSYRDFTALPEPPSPLLLLAGMASIAFLMARRNQTSVM